MLLSLLKRLLPGAGPGEPASASAAPGAVASASNEAAFTESLMHEFFLLVHQVVHDNYDHVRFGYDGTDRSGTMNVAGHARYLNFFFRHAADFLAASETLHDPASRDLFRRLILYRMLGHLHVKIRQDFGWGAETELYSRAQTYDRSGSALQVHGLFGPLRHHTDVPTPGKPVTLDCWNANVVYTALKRQYFVARDGLTIEPGQGDVVIDAGACFGDTAVYFAETIGAGGRVYAFDPLPAHQAVIGLNVAQNGLEDRVVPVPLAVSDRTWGTALSAAAVSQPGDVAQPGFSLRDAENDIPMTSIDDYVQEHEVPRVDFIKMDIEGHELAALVGAQRVIAAFRPRLAISLYHRPGDFFEIPLWLRRNFPWYDLHLEHYTIHQEETVLFGVPRAA
jgi:FkbM family methyltransferase